jgi:hypothetical protein
MDELRVERDERVGLELVSGMYSASSLSAQPRWSAIFQAVF